jgi:hypothetical protein
MFYAHNALLLLTSITPCLGASRYTYSLGGTHFLTEASLEVSNSGFESEAARRLIYDVVGAWERLFGIRPSVKTMIKIMKVEELLKRGATPGGLSAALALGKSFYKYAPLIYLGNPDLSIPIPKHFLRQYTHIMDFEP